MNQPHEVLTATVTAFGGIAVGLAAIVALKLARGDRPGQASAGPVPTGFRYCPGEQRTRAVVVHPDGSASCDCGTTIPATAEEAPRA